MTSLKSILLMGLLALAGAAPALAPEMASAEANSTTRAPKLAIKVVTRFMHTPFVGRNPTRPLHINPVETGIVPCRGGTSRVNLKKQRKGFRT
jgi:hypothetical protein